MERLRLHEAKRYLCTESGDPFFWLGDTAWEIFHKLNREEVLYYLDRRAEQGFNVIQAALLAEQDSLRVPNAYGRLPLSSWSEEYIIADIKGPYSYWDHVSFVLDEAEKRGMYVAVLPTWGDKWNQLGGKGPQIFTPANTRGYIQWLAERLRKRTNVIYILGGDRYFTTQEQRQVIQIMGETLKELHPDALVTFHAWGPGSSLDMVGSPEWLDFHMLQTGHFSDRDTYRLMEHVYQESADNPKPVIDGEPHYENHPIDFDPENGMFSDWDVRQGSYWSVFSGGFGITYGNASVWGMTEPQETTDFYPISWKEAMEQPGASQMRFLKELMLSRPFFSRRPDQSILKCPLSWEAHLTASVGEGCIMVYNPDGREIVLKRGSLSAESTCVTWFYPQTGQYLPGGVVNRSDVLRFTPPYGGTDGTGYSF